jgi:hypothetical protein
MRRRLSCYSQSHLRRLKLNFSFLPGIGECSKRPTDYTNFHGFQLPRTGTIRVICGPHGGILKGNNYIFFSKHKLQ